MKRSEPTPETLRSSAQLRDRQTGEPPPRREEPSREGGDAYRPQYLDLPPRAHGGGVRNVLLGMFLVFGAALLLGYAAYLIGPRAVMPLGIALLTAATLFALARLRLFRQRNGGFVALGIVCLVGVLVPLVEYAWTRETRAPIEEPAEVEARPVERPTASNDSKTTPLSLKEAFSLSTPPPDAFGFRVLQDLQVEIDGKKYVINEGDVFAVGEMTGEDVRFSAGDEQIALPLNMVEMIGSPEPEKTAAAQPEPPPAAANPATVASTPAKSGPVNITEEAQREAIRRYPAIGVKNSPENRLFLESYQELKYSGADDFFANPEWPLALADMLAKREGWNQPGGKPAQAAPPAAGQGLPEETVQPEDAEAPRPKRRPVAEELDDEPEPTPEPGAPMQETAPQAPDNTAELPAE